MFSFRLSLCYYSLLLSLLIWFAPCHKEIVFASLGFPFFRVITQNTRSCCFETKKITLFEKVTLKKTRSRLRSEPTNRISEIKITGSHDERILWPYGGKLLIVYNHPARFDGHMRRYCGNGDKFFLFTTWPHLTTCSKGCVT